jgi:glucan phosphoethanolaminetransferase (alkaline phosphatase superfamily)
MLGNQTLAPVRPTRDRYIAILALASCFVLLMLPNMTWLWHFSEPRYWVNAFIVPLILVTAVYAAFGNRLWLACLLLLPFVVLAPLEAFYSGTYWRPSSSDIIATIVASNLRETREYLGSAIIPVLICFACATTLGVASIVWCKSAQLRWVHRSRGWFVFICGATLLVAILIEFAMASGSLRKRFERGLHVVDVLTESVELGYPFGIVKRVRDYRNELDAVRAQEALLEEFHFGAGKSAVAPGRQVYVLIIGEASRRDRWQLFGYTRATTPQLVGISNLVLMSDMVSSWPVSMLAIPMVITRKPANVHELTWREPSILRAMEEAGFETYWISNQMMIGPSDSTVSQYAFEADHRLFLNHANWLRPGSYDEDLVAPFVAALKSSGRDMFVVLHMMGSHEAYDYRYPRSFAQFQPTMSDSASPASVYDRTSNSYDNSIRYTDHVVASIIRALEESGELSALWFESDHGENLPTPVCSIKGHGYGTPYDFQVPAFVWYSDAYGRAFPERIRQLRNHADKRMTSAVTFESVVDLVGVTFPGHDESMSLFSSSWRGRQRKVHGLWEVDIDTADLGKNCSTLLPPDSTLLPPD